MDLKLVGAGLCRTGTRSLKDALERLLGAPCYHMAEVFYRPEDVAEWRRAAAGGTPDWETLLRGCAAEVDLPASLWWRELAAANPDAPVLLSTRSSPQAWWRSVEATVLATLRRGIAAGDDSPPRLMVDELVRNRFCPDFDDPDAMMAAYTAHNEAVRAGVAPERLVEWQPGDGWEPLCAALGVPVPDEEFPNVNSTSEFRERAGLG